MMLPAIRPGLPRLSSYRPLLRLPCRHLNQRLQTGSKPTAPSRHAPLPRRCPAVVASENSLVVILHPSAQFSSAAATTTATTTNATNAAAATPPPPDNDGTSVAYTPPTTGILSLFPARAVPYAELVRLDKPTGTYYLFFPCLFSTLLAAPLATAMPAPADVAATSLLFLAGAFVMRGAGCTINDLLDRNLDRHVRRTRLRPMARGSIGPTAGVLYAGAQLLAGLAVLLHFPAPCFFYALPSLAVMTVYPLAKRITHYPQVVFGLAFSWGTIMGFPALGVDLLSDPTAAASAALLYGSTMAWCVLYDMIYAHQDVQDDAKAGIKSIALRHGAQTKQILTGLAAVQVGLLAAAGAVAGAGPAFFVGSCGGAVATLGIMIRRVDLKSARDCWWWFANGCWMTGGIISLGLGADYLIQYYSQGADGADGDKAGENKAEFDEIERGPMLPQRGPDGSLG